MDLTESNAMEMPAFIATKAQADTAATKWRKATMMRDKGSIEGIEGNESSKNLKTWNNSDGISKLWAILQDVKVWIHR